MIPATLSVRCHAPLRTALFVLAALLLPAAAAAQARSSLAVRTAGGRQTWWSSERAPGAWRAPDPRVQAAVRWSRLRRGLRLGELELLVNRGLLRLQVIIVEAVVPEFDVALQARTERGRAAWRLEHAPAGAALAINAGQFSEAAPWGWLVVDGRTRQPPGYGPLSAGIGAGTAGLQWLDPPALADRWRESQWLAGFQSYPVLLRAGSVPAALREGGGQVDLEHRDARLALGFRGDTLLVAITRYAGLGRVLQRLPAGLTTPETAALMGALGAQDALMLDGGLSAQLLVRDSAGATRAWPGSRAVPLALVLTPKRDGPQPGR